MSAYSPGETKEIIRHVCILIIINGLALILNLLVIIPFLRYRRILLEGINNMFLFSMALADFFVGAFGILAHLLMYLFRVSGEVKSMDTWKLLGVLPFFGSAFMSVFSIGIMTADRLISVQNALRYYTIMSKFRAKMMIVLSWFTTAIIIIVQGMIYLRVSPETELTARLYVLPAVVMIGGTFLVIANAKLYLIINSKLRRISTITNKKTGCGSNQTATTTSMSAASDAVKLKTRSLSKQNSQKTTTIEMNNQFSSTHISKEKLNTTMTTSSLLKIRGHSSEQNCDIPKKRRTTLVLNNQDSSINIDKEKSTTTTTAANSVQINGHSSEESGDVPKTMTSEEEMMTVRQMITQNESVQNGKEISTLTTALTSENCMSIKPRLNSYQNDCELMTTGETNSIKITTSSGTESKRKVNSVNSKSQRKSRNDRICSISVHKSSICIWMTALFVISWGPLTIYFLVCAITRSKGTTNLDTVSIGLASANSFFNPIVYFAKRENFRRYFLKFYGCVAKPSH